MLKIGASFIILGLACSGCASIVTGRYQDVAVTSEPPGIEVRASTGATITTPGSFNLVRNKPHVLTAYCPGQAPQTRTLHPHIQGWFFGNILLGGIPGMLVDMITGACDRLEPGGVHFAYAARAAAAEGWQIEGYQARINKLTGKIETYPIYTRSEK